MKHLKYYNEYSDMVYIFDLDDTLLHTPSFNDLAIEYINENESIKDLVQNSLKLVNKSKSDLEIEHGRIYIDDPNKEIIIKGNWVRKGERVYMLTPNIYGLLDISLPTELTEIIDIYNKSKNKAIVTARSIEIQDKIESILDKFEINYPNLGLFCYPSKIQNKVAEWKGNTIVNIIGNKFKKAVFYDDNAKNIKIVRKIVNHKLPNIEFEAIKI